MEYVNLLDLAVVEESVVNSTGGFGGYVCGFICGNICGNACGFLC
jgi:hypothetical protein